MAHLNRWQGIGNLGQDPEVRSTPNGQTVATFSVACNRKWKDRDGNSQEATEWVQIVAWGRTAEIAGQYLTRGRQVYVEGRLQTRSWDDPKTGEKRYKTEVVCDTFQMLGNRDGGGERQERGGYGGGGYGQRAASKPAPDYDEFGSDDDDSSIPF